MKKNKKIIIIGIITLLLLSIIVISILILNKDNNNQNEIKTVEKIDEMDNYDYYLEETATMYYKELYDDLKDILNEEEINKEEYAKKVAQLFVTDLFTLDNKITTNDIGGLQFVYTDFKEDFINIAKTTIYSAVKSNIYGDRNQELPIVRSTIVNSIENSSFTYQDEEYDSYNILLSIEYEKDLGYPVEHNVTLINNDKYLQVASSE